MLKNTYFIFALIAILGCSREEEISVNLPFKKKLVAQVYIGQNDEMLTATLTHTTPVFGTNTATEPSYESGATVWANVNGTDYRLTYDPNTFEYNSDLLDKPITENDIIKFKANNELETISGQTKIPEKPLVSFDLVLDSNLNDFYFYHAKITCKLLSPGKKQLRILAKITYSDSITVFLGTKTFSPIASINSGQSFTEHFYGYKITEFGYPVKIECFAANCDDAYTKYYNNTVGFNFAELLPISEPTIAFSNMSNNIGVIASYSLSNHQIFTFQ
jgi:hypothetical protein